MKNSAALTKRTGLSFRVRLIAAFIALLAAVLLSTLVIVDVTAERSVRQQLSERLQVSERVWAQLLDANAERLLESVSLLAKDFAFREAVATADGPTAQSALLNHAQRIRTDLALLLEPDGTLRNRSEIYRAVDMHTVFEPLLKRAEQDGESSDVILLDGQPYLVALVPVLAPRRIAWVAMGVLYGETLAKQYKALVGLDVAFVDRQDTALSVRSSTLPSAQREAIATSPLSMPDVRPEVTLAGVRYAVREFNAADITQGKTRVMLLAGLDEALEPAHQLMKQIILLTALAATVALIFAVMVGRGISRPVTRLAWAARRIGEGDYSPLPVYGDNEFADLAAAFNTMQAGIAQREERILHQARHDALTNLPNRSHALDRLERAINDARRKGGSCAVLMLDLNRFKEVNDTLGHAFGDEVLKVVAQRLRHVVRGDDFLARLGGDEFLVVLEGANQAVARDRADKLVACLDDPVAPGKADVLLNASAGVAVFPEHAEDAATLLRRADVAMYEAKQVHGGVAIYELGQDEHHMRQVALMGELRLAHDRNQLSLAFQPKIDLSSGRVAHVEALLRWVHPQWGNVSPDEFIPLAERSGIISTITRYVVDEALKQANAWIQKGLIEGIAINLSPIDLLDKELPRYVREKLLVHGVKAECLMLEVTESTVMRDVAASLNTMHDLRNFGVRLSIDDFGTGHSSLAHLRRLPVDEIKIDKSFILGLSSGNEDTTIIRSAVEIGHNIGLSVIAEGVEDALTLKVLQSLKCDMAQGYLFSRPLPADELVHWCETYNQRNVNGALHATLPE